MQEPIVYTPAERPLCEVFHEDAWYPGEVRMWQRRPEGWFANVGYSLGAGQNALKTCPATFVRGVEPPS